MADEHEAPSMADSIASAIETVEQADATPTPSGDVGAPPTETPTQAAPQTPAAPERAGAPQRGADGKFLKRGEAASPDAGAAPAAAAAVPAADPAKAAAATPAAGAADAAPTAWTPAAKEKWAALDPAVKGEIARREHEIEAGMSKATEVRRFGDSVMAEFAPYAQLLAKEGATPQGAIRSLLETVHTLRYGSPEHKHALFMSMAQQYGIDLEHQIDPEKARLQWELDSRNMNDQRAVTQQQEALQRDVASELDTFIATPGHEHYPTVRLAMAGLMQSGTVTELQDAYDRACWADPQVRAALQLAENTRRAADLGRNRNALLAVNGGPGSIIPGSPSVDPNNMRALIESQFQGGAAGGRV